MPTLGMPRWSTCRCRRAWRKTENRLVLQTGNSKGMRLDREGQSMTEVVNVHAAKTHFSKPLRRVDVGEEVVLDTQPPPGHYGPSWMMGTTCTPSGRRYAAPTEVTTMSPARS